MIHIDSTILFHLVWEDPNYLFSPRTQGPKFGSKGILCFTLKFGSQEQNH